MKEKARVIKQKLIVATPTEEICQRIWYGFANFGELSFWVWRGDGERTCVKIPKIRFVETETPSLTTLELIPITMSYYSPSTGPIPKLTKEDTQEKCYMNYLLVEENIIPYLALISKGHGVNFAPRGLTGSGETVLAPAPYTGSWAKWLELKIPEIRKLERKLMTPAEVLQELRRMNGLENYPFPDLPF